VSGNPVAAPARDQMRAAEGSRLTTPLALRMPRSAPFRLRLTGKDLARQEASSRVSPAAHARANADPLTRFRVGRRALCRLSIMAPQLSNQMLRLASAMLEDPEVPSYGLELSKSAGLKTGTIYPALARMERSGWVESRWETERPEDLGRPRRRLYQLTGAGEVALRDAIDEQVRAIQSPMRRTRPGWPKARTA
jgi:PadR family transcriptional regulator, regulatory protein PadR